MILDENEYTDLGDGVYLHLSGARWQKFKSKMKSAAKAVGKGARAVQRAGESECHFANEYRDNVSKQQRKLFQQKCSDVNAVFQTCIKGKHPDGEECNRSLEKSKSQVACGDVEGKVKVNMAEKGEKPVLEERMVNICEWRRR